MNIELDEYCADCGKRRDASATKSMELGVELPLLFYDDEGRAKSPYERLYSHCYPTAISIPSQAHPAVFEDSTAHLLRDFSILVSSTSLFRGGLTGILEAGIPDPEPPI